MDEGMKNIGNHLFENLQSKGIDVRFLDLGDTNMLSNPGRTMDFSFWQRIYSIDPDITHLVPGPSVRGLVLLELIARLTGSKSIATVTQPQLSRLWSLVSGYFVPDRLLIQSPDVDEYYASRGFDTYLLPLSGVDLKKFSPVSAGTRQRLRRKLQLPQDDPVFLHVGHLTQNRNLGDLVPLANHGELLVVSSPGTDTDVTVVDYLEEEGCQVRIEYCPDIEKYFQSADVYVFPVKSEDGSVKIPLTVLEAMACNVPVVTTPFGGLPGLFDEGKGLQYVSFESETSYQAVLDCADRHLTKEVTLRRRVEQYSWSTITDRLIDIYRSVLGHGT